MKLNTHILIKYLESMRLRLDYMYLYTLDTTVADALFIERKNINDLIVELKKHSK